MMPVLDQCHPQVVRALEKEGWTIAPAPFTIKIDRGHSVHIDIKAQVETQVGQQTIIVIEVKCFADRDAETTDLYGAIGQYLVYRGLLKRRLFAYPLYLAVPNWAYHGIFQRMAIEVVTETQIRMIVLDMQNEVIEPWLE